MNFTLAAPVVNRKLNFGADAPAPVRLTEKYRPSTLADVVGQGAAVYQLQSFVDAPYPNAFVFAGDTGIGKTTCARAMAADMGMNRDWDIDVIESGQCLDEVLDKSLRMLRQRGINGWRVLIIEEADTMSAKCKQVLLSALEDIPQGAIIVLTTNHADRFESRFRDRCDVITFASDCGMLTLDAQTLVNRVWMGETGEDTAPDVATLPNVCEAGKMSFRRVVNAVASALRSWVPAPAPVEVNTMHDAYDAFLAADEAWSAELKRSFGREARNVRYQEQGEGEAGSELNRTYLAFQSTGDAWRNGLGDGSPEPTPPPVSGGSPEVVEVEAPVKVKRVRKPKAENASDALIMATLADSREHYRPTPYTDACEAWDRFSIEEGRGIMRRLTTFGFDKAKPTEAPSARFARFVTACHNGVVLPTRSHTPDPDYTPPTPEPITQVDPPVLTRYPLDALIARKVAEIVASVEAAEEAIIDPEPGVWLESDYPAYPVVMSGDDQESMRHNWEGELARLVEAAFPNLLTLIQSSEYRTGTWSHSLYYHCPLDGYGKRRYQPGESVEAYAARILGASGVVSVGRFSGTLYFAALKPEPEPTPEPTVKVEATLPTVEATEFATETCSRAVRLLNQLRKARFMATTEGTKQVVDREELAKYRAEYRIASDVRPAREDIRELRECATRNGFDPERAVLEGMRLARERFRADHPLAQQFLYRGHGVYPGARERIEGNRSERGQVEAVEAPIVEENPSVLDQYQSDITRFGEDHPEYLGVLEGCECDECESVHDEARAAWAGWLATERGTLANEPSVGAGASLANTPPLRSSGSKTDLPPVTLVGIKNEDGRGIDFPCSVCGREIGWDAPSGVCSSRCLNIGQGFPWPAPAPAEEPITPPSGLPGEETDTPPTRISGTENEIAPTVDDLVADRLRAVEEIARVVLECEPTWSIADRQEGPSDPREREIGLFSREARSLVLKAVEMHYSGHRWAEWASSEVWEAASDDDRECLVGFLRAIRFIPDGHEVATDTGASEFFGDFVTLCIHGEAVSFPVPPMPDDDLDRMARILEDTAPCQSYASTPTSTASRGEASSSPTTDRCSIAPSATTIPTTRATTRPDGARATASTGNRTTTDTTDTMEPETCTTPRSGRYSASRRAGGPAGTPAGSLVDNALAALSNAPNTETTHDEPVRDREARRDRNSCLLLAGSDRPGPGHARPGRFDDLPHRPIAPVNAPRDAGATLVRIDDAHRQRDEDPIGLMVEGMPIAYLDEMGPDDTIDDFAQYPPSGSAHRKTTYPPAAVYGTENERDVRDAIQAFGAC